MFIMLQPAELWEVASRFMDVQEVSTVHLWDEDLRLAWINDPMCKWHPLKTRESLLGKSYDDIYPQYPEFKQVLAEALRTAEPTWSIKLPELKSPITGAMTHWMTDVVPVQVRGARFIVVRGVNVTIAERALAQKTRDLEAAVRARDEFLSVAAHELRTPVSAIMLLSEVLQTLCPLIPEGMVRTKFNKLRQSLARQATRLSELIDDLLDVSRVQSGRVEVKREKMDLAQIVTEIGSKLSTTAENAGCELRYHVESIEGEWDRRLLGNIVANYLSNAIKYGAGKPVEIRLFPKNGHAHFVVRDHGPGVNEQDRERIFHKYERAVPTGAVQGLGLGLWIVEQAACALGGEAFVTRPADGSGAQFECRLPRGTQ